MADKLFTTLTTSLGRGEDKQLCFDAAPLRDFVQSVTALSSGERVYNLLHEVMSFSSFLAHQQHAPMGAEQLLSIVPPLMQRLQQLVHHDAAMGARLERAQRDLERTQKSLAATPQMAGIAPARKKPGVVLRKKR